MRRALPLPLLLLILLAGRAEAFTYSRVLAPAVDLTPYTPVLIAPLDSNSRVWVDGHSIAQQLAARINREGYVAVRVSSGGLIARDGAQLPNALATEATQAGAGAVLVGSIEADEDFQTGSTSVWKQFEIWREEVDQYGNRRRIKDWETRQVWIRTEQRTVTVEVRLQAIDPLTGRALGYQSVRESASDSWQEDSYNTLRSRGELLNNALPGALERLALQFTPYTVEVWRKWRPERGKPQAIAQGVAAAEAGDYPTAIARFRQSVTEVPEGAWDALGNLAIIYDAQGDYASARAAITEALGYAKGGHNLEAYARDIDQTWLPSAIAPRVVVEPPPLHEPEPVVVDPRKRVIRLEEDRVFLDAGSLDGWGEGALVQITVEEEIRDLNGASLGLFTEVVGTIRIDTVKDRFAIGHIESLEPERVLAVGQIAALVSETQALTDVPPEDTPESNDSK